MHTRATYRTNFGFKDRIERRSNSLHLVDLDTGDPILRSQDEVEQTIFRCSLAIKKQRRSIADANVASRTQSTQSTWSQTPEIGCAYRLPLMAMS